MSSSIIRHSYKCFLYTNNLLIRNNNFNKILSSKPFYLNKSQNRSLHLSTLNNKNDYPKHITVTLPSLSPTMTQGKIVSWKKNEGDVLEEGDIIAEVETDKAIVPLETPKPGFLAKILVPEGASYIQLKELIAIIVKDKNDIASFKDYKKVESTQTTTEPTSKQENIPVASSTDHLKSGNSKVNEDHLKATPMAKNISNVFKVDLKNVHPSSAVGRITAIDVKDYLKNTESPSSNDVSVKHSTNTYEDLELSGIRKTIAKRLVESKQNIPHYYLSLDVKMDESIKLKDEFNMNANNKYKLSLNDFVIKASSLALKNVPECNSSFMDNFIRRYSNVDISIAVNTDHGLITPIVFQADQKGLVEINKNVRTLAEKAKLRTIQPHEFQGGTFSISNLGMFGIRSFTAVINPPQSCILAVGSVQKRPEFNGNDNNTIKWASFMTVTLSCDHRVVDGAIGAQWLTHFKKYLENPISMIL